MVAVHVALTGDGGVVMARGNGDCFYWTVKLDSRGGIITERGAALKRFGNNRCLDLLPEVGMTGRVALDLTSSGQEIVNFAWSQRGNPPEIYPANKHLPPIGLVVVVPGSLRAQNCALEFESESTGAGLYLLKQDQRINFQGEQFCAQGYSDGKGNREIKLVCPSEVDWH